VESYTDLKTKPRDDLAPAGNTHFKNLSHERHQPNRKSSWAIFENLTNSQEELVANLTNCLQKIAPVWPFENFVAVNPLFGICYKKF